jgi:hypothetical protein
LSKTTFFESISILYELISKTHKFITQQPPAEADSQPNCIGKSLNTINLPLQRAMVMAKYQLNVNSDTRPSRSDTPILWVLRIPKFLGTKYGCGIAHVVHRFTPAGEAAKLAKSQVSSSSVTKITTIEGREKQITHREAQVPTMYHNTCILSSWSN